MTEAAALGGVMLLHSAQLAMGNDRGVVPCREGSGSGRAAEPTEACREIFDQILYRLEADMNAQQNAFGLPVQPMLQPFLARRHDQTFEAAPAVAHAEELHIVQHSRQLLTRDRKSVV